MEQPIDTVALPFLNPRVHVFNGMGDKRIHVIVTPNEDYVLAEILVGFASLASGGLSLVNTTNDFFILLRTLSFLKKAKELSEKIKGILPSSSLTLGPMARAEVLNAIKDDPLIYTKPTGIISLFGGATATLLIVDEDLTRTVKFNTALDEEYIVNETGVGNSKNFYFWNGGSLPAGQNSSVPPSLIRHGEDMLLFYRHDKGDRIFVAEFQDGKFARKGRGWLNQDTSAGVGVTTMRNKLCVVGRHAQGNQMYALWDKKETIPWDTSVQNGTYKWQGIDIRHKPAATTVGDVTYIVALREFTSPLPFAEVLRTTMRADGSVTSGGTGIASAQPPALHAFKGKLCMVYVHPASRSLCMATSTDGQKWEVTVGETGHGRLCKTNAGVALTVYNNRLYVFYRDYDGNGVFYAWTEDGSSFKFPPQGQHYFGFDVEWEPTASPMPGENNGIMVAGIAPPGTKWFVFSEAAEVMHWTTLMPYEPGKPGSQGVDPSGPMAQS